MSLSEIHHHGAVKERSAPNPGTLRVVILCIISAMIGRSFGMGSFSSTVATNHVRQRDHGLDSPYVRSDHRELGEIIGKANETTEISAVTDVVDTNNTNATAEPMDTIHVIYGLSGNTTNFTDEFHCSLKSIILNAPVDMAMNVYILADGAAYNALDKRTESEIHLPYLISRHPITIEIFNMDNRAKTWRTLIISCTGHWPSLKHTMGTFFRLFAYDVLPVEVEHVIYLDTDAFVFSNLQELWKHRNSTAMFQWGIETRCAGFMILNIKEMRLHFWDMVNSTYAKDYRRNVNDQEIFRHIMKFFPQLVGFLPAAWDNHKADNFIKLNKGNLLKKRKDMGMLHFNGGGGADSNVCLQPKRIEYSVIPYIANHPWQWVGFHLRSQVPPGKEGYPVVLKKTTL